jgi:hypothetical protein
MIYLLVRWVRRRAYIKATLTAMVLALFLYPTIQTVIEYRRFMAKYEPAKALFDEKCKTAGERIYKTAEGVEGILLPKILESTFEKSESETVKNQMWPQAAIENAFSGVSYVVHYLGERHSGTYTKDPSTGKRVPKRPILPGYKYVDVVNAEDGKRYRLRAEEAELIEKEWRKGFMPETPTTEPAPRHAVHLEHNVDPTLRKHWIAGSLVRVVDTTTNETLGELEVWKFDRSVGHTPWLNWSTSAATCPSISYDDIQYFVKKTLKAKQGN